MYEAINTLLNLLCSALLRIGAQRIETRSLSHSGVSVSLKNPLVLTSSAVCVSGSSPPSMSARTPGALFSAWQRGHSEILDVMTVMITNGAGSFSEQNMVVWGLIFGKQHPAFIVTREEVVIAKWAGESLTQ